MKKIFLITLIFVLVTGCQNKENKPNVNETVEIAKNHSALSISIDDEKVDTRIFPTIKKNDSIDIYFIKKQDDKAYYAIIDNLKVIELYNQNNATVDNKPHHITVVIEDELFKQYMTLHDRENIKILILKTGAKYATESAIKKDIKDLI